MKPVFEEARLNRFPIAFAQTVAFAAAAGSIAWQALRLMLERGASFAPTFIALTIAGAFALGAVLYALVLAPARKRLAAGVVDHTPGRLRLLNIAISTVWLLAWAAPGIQLIAAGGFDAFWGLVCFSMGGLSGALFYEPVGSARTPV